MNIGGKVLLLHGAALVVLMLTAIAGDSGGSGTETLFQGLWVLGWATILVSLVMLVRLFFRKMLEGPDVAMLVVLMIVGFLESRLVVSDMMMLRSLFH